jgi:hypothetical protein
MKKTSYNRLTDEQQMRRDNALADFLFAHKGKNNAVSSREIARYLNDRGFPQKEHTTQMLVNRVAEQKHLPICASNTGGYFWAESKAELQAYISYLESRAAALKDHIDRLKPFILE